MSALTAGTPSAEELLEARTSIARDLNTVHELLARAAVNLPHAIYKDPSQLGLDRARLNIAQRLVSEVACSMVDLTFLPGVDSGEEG